MRRGLPSASEEAMDNGSSLEQRIQALRREGPSPDLRARVLALAESIERPRVTLTERVWASRPLRLAWVATLAILVLLDPAAGQGTYAGHAGRELPGSARAPLRKLARDAGLRDAHLGGLLHPREIQLDINDARREEIGDIGGELEI